MSEEKFEKQKLDQNDYKKEEKKISVGKILGGVAIAVIGVVIKLITHDDTPSTSA